MTSTRIRGGTWNRRRHHASPDVGIPTSLETHKSTLLIYVPGDSGEKMMLMMLMTITMNKCVHAHTLDLLAADVDVER